MIACRDDNLDACLSSASHCFSDTLARGIFESDQPEKDEARLTRRQGRLWLQAPVGKGEHAQALFRKASSASLRRWRNFRIKGATPLLASRSVQRGITVSGAPFVYIALPSTVS